MKNANKTPAEHEALPAVTKDAAADRMETEVKPGNQAKNVEDDCTVRGCWVDIETLRQTDMYRDLFKRDPDVVARIKENMKEHGFDQSYPIITYDNVIVDGNCRYEIAKELGLRKVFTTDSENPPESELAQKTAIFSQVARRNITDADIIKFVEKMDALKKSGRPAKLASPDANKGKSAAILAKKLNVSPSKVEKARKTLKSGDQAVIQQVKDGCKSLNQAAGKMKDDQGDADKPVYPKVLKALQQAVKYSGNDSSLRSDIEALIQKVESKLSV